MAWAWRNNQYIFVSIGPIYDKIISFWKRVPTCLDLRNINCLFSVMIFHFSPHVAKHCFFEVFIGGEIFVPISRVCDEHHIFDISVSAIWEYVVVVWIVLKVNKNGELANLVLFRVFHFPISNNLFDVLKQTSDFRN